MKANAVIKNYSNALFERSLEIGNPEIILKELDKVLESISINHKFKKFMLSPSAPYKMKSVFVQTVLQSIKIGNITSSFVELLLKNNRMIHIEKVRDNLRSLIDEHNGIKRVTLKTVSELDSSLIDLVKSDMESILRNKVKVENIIEPKILGGIVLQVDSKVLDCSIASKLNKIRNLVQVSQ